jgi:hypothetical protein
MLEFVVTLAVSVVVTLSANFLVGALFLRPMGRRVAARRRRDKAQAAGH